MADSMRPDGSKHSSEPRNEVNKSRLNETQQREFNKVNDLLVSRGLPAQSEADYLQAVHFNTATTTTQQTDRRERSFTRARVGTAII